MATISGDRGHIYVHHLMVKWPVSRRWPPRLECVMVEGGDRGQWAVAPCQHQTLLRYTAGKILSHTHPYKWGCTSAPPALLGPTQCAVNKRSLNFSIVVSTEACLGAKMDIFMQCKLATIPWKLFNRQQSPVAGRRWKYTMSLGRRSQTQLHTALTAHITHNPCHDEEDFLSPLKQYSRVSHTKTAKATFYTYSAFLQKQWKVS